MGPDELWKPQPGPQEFAFACPHFEVFYGGARGGGKTDWAIGTMAYRAQRYGAAMRGLFVRRTLTQLSDAIRRAKEIYLPLGATWREAGKTFTFPGGGTVAMAYLERDEDAEQYQGWSLTDVSVEELGNFPDPGPVLKLMAALRSAQGVPVQFRATGNPGGPGQFWIKERYVTPSPMGLKTLNYWISDPVSGKAIRRDRIYIPARLRDNPILLRNDPSYIANLAMQASPQLVRAWLMGDWDAIVGAYFSEFSTEQHVVLPVDLPASWTRIMAMDWGSARPFAVLWFAVSDGSLAAFPRGALIVEREWYGCRDGQPNTGLKLPVEDVARGIVLRERRASRSESADEGLSGRPRSLVDALHQRHNRHEHQPRGGGGFYRVADPAMFAQDGGPSMAERVYRATEGEVNLTPADNARVAQRGAMGGWDQVRARLKGDPDGRPMLYIFETCRHLIRTLPAMQHDPDRPEDLDSAGEDHACFAAGTMIEGHGSIEAIGIMTRVVAQCVLLTFSNGHAIVCTPNHLFLTDSGAWQPARNLENHRLCSAIPSKTSLDSTIIAAVLTFSARACDFIAWCLNTIMVRLQRGCIPITSMAIQQTMRLIIWRSLPSKSTWPKDTAMRSAPVGEERSNSLSSPLPNGIEARLAGNGMPSIGIDRSARWSSNVLRKLARYAGQLSRRAASLRVAHASAIPTAKPVLCVRVEPLNERPSVYCMATKEGLLTVQGGLIASNCDALRYGCMSRPMIADRPKDEASVETILTRAARAPTFQQVVAQRHRIRMGELEGRV